MALASAKGTFQTYTKISFFTSSRRFCFDGSLAGRSINHLIPIWLQLQGASPELINRLIPEHVRRQAGLSFSHPAGT